MEHKEPIKVSGKTIGATLIGFVGALMLGIGMCLTMVWSSMIVGIIVGTHRHRSAALSDPLCERIENKWEKSRRVRGGSPGETGKIPQKSRRVGCERSLRFRIEPGRFLLGFGDCVHNLDTI